jgi:DNA mismatch repair ATPase MutL
LAKIKQMMQAYAFARPSVRFQVRVLKATNGKNGFLYAPSANTEDVAFKVVGKDCALQCEWTALEENDYEINAFIPRADAVGSKIANLGSFVSVDARPVTTSRGTLKQVCVAFWITDSA